MGKRKRKSISDKPDECLYVKCKFCNGEGYVLQTEVKVKDEPEWNSAKRPPVYLSTATNSPAAGSGMSGTVSASSDNTIAVKDESDVMIVEDIPTEVTVLGVRVKKEEAAVILIEDDDGDAQKNPAPIVAAAGHEKLPRRSLRPRPEEARKYLIYLHTLLEPCQHVS